MTALHSLTASQLRSLSIVSTPDLQTYRVQTYRAAGCHCPSVLPCPDNYCPTPSMYLGSKSGLCLTGGEVGVLEGREGGIAHGGT